LKISNPPILIKRTQIMPPAIKDYSKIVRRSDPINKDLAGLGFQHERKPVDHGDYEQTKIVLP
jgi:hypothetical protein